MIKQIADGIYEVEDFLNQNELSTLILSITLDGFVEYHKGNIVKNLIDESMQVLPSINDKIISYFANAKSKTPITNIRRLLKGEFMYPHIDGGYPDAKDKIVFGIAIYLNDDFEGGELNYPDLKISVKPKKSSMIIHDARFLHEVLPVTDGARYSITTFIFGDDTTKVKI